VELAQQLRQDVRLVANRAQRLIQRHAGRFETRCNLQLLTRSGPINDISLERLGNAQLDLRSVNSVVERRQLRRMRCQLGVHLVECKLRLGIVLDMSGECRATSDFRQFGATRNQVCTLGLERCQRRRTSGSRRSCVVCWCLSIRHFAPRLKNYPA
jgi:hypothetical protein